MTLSWWLHCQCKHNMIASWWSVLIRVLVHWSCICLPVCNAHGKEKASSLTSPGDAILQHAALHVMAVLFRCSKDTTFYSSTQRRSRSGDLYALPQGGILVLGRKGWEQQRRLERCDLITLDHESPCILYRYETKQVNWLWHTDHKAITRWCSAFGEASLAKC